MKDAKASSSGMQITIRKGPDDQTERVVNSDKTNVHWNRVNFGDKKYIKLQCPHCETVCVTFNVSTIVVFIAYTFKLNLLSITYVILTISQYTSPSFLILGI